MHVRTLKFGAVVVVVLTVAAALSAQAPKSKSSLTPVASDSSRLIERVHFAFRDEGPAFVGGHSTYSARVVAGAFELTAFDNPGGRGTPIEFSTQEVRRGERLVSNQEPTALRDETGALRIDRGEVVERLANTANGLAQSWVLGAQPSGHGDLVVRVEVHAKFAGASASGLHFSSGVLGFNYGLATWVDAAGLKTPVTASYDGAAVVLRVPNEVLEHSSYPAVLDPLVSPEVLLDQPVSITAFNSQLTPAIAFNGTNYLMVWADARTGTGLNDIYGARLSSSGGLVDVAGIRIATGTTGSKYSPAVATDGTDFLVVWSDTVTGPSSIYSSRVTGGGVSLEPLGKSIAYAGSGLDYQSPAVAWSGTSYLVVWDEYDSNDPFGHQVVRGVRVDSSNTVIGLSFNISATNTSAYFAHIDWDGSNFLVVYQQNNVNIDVLGARVSSSGTVQPGSPFTISANAGNQFLPTLAWNGTTHLVVWHDDRVSTNYDVYGARVASSGAVTDPSGFVISNAASSQVSPQISAQGAGFMVVWEDSRAGSTDIYGAQVSGAAVVNPPSGTLISNAANSQRSPVLASDGTSALVAWEDYRTTPPGASDLYGTLVNAAGTVGSPSGVLLTKQANAQTEVSVAFDGTNYLAVWQDQRGLTSDIYAARVSQAGVVLDVPAFVISAAANNQKSPAVTWTGSTYFVAWQDDRTISGNFDIYAARVTAAGVVTDATGIAVSTAANSQTSPSVAGDGTNVLVVWQDERVMLGTYDIYGARVSAAGIVLEPAGLVISQAANRQFTPSVAWNGATYLVAWPDLKASPAQIRGARVTPGLFVMDPVGVAISIGATAAIGHPGVATNGNQFFITWADARGNADLDIYGTRLSPDSGTILDSPNIAISTTVADQTAPAVASDGTTYQVVWQDHRNSASNWELYGTRVSTTTAAVLDAPALIISNNAGDDTAPALAAAGPRKFLVGYQTFALNSTMNAFRAAARSLGNAGPTATSQSVNTDEDTPLVIITSGTDADQDPLTMTLVTGPTHGTLTGTLPSVTYTPASNYNGADSFTFKVNDGFVDSAPGTVMITVQAVNDAPVAQTQSTSTLEDTAVLISLAGTDVEGSPLTYTVVNAPSRGSFSGTAPLLTYTPFLNLNGPDSFTFKVNDGTAASAPATVSISVTAVNDAPMATAQSVLTLEDTPVSFVIAGTDVEGSPLTFSIVAAPAHGTLSGTAPNLVYTPSANFNLGDGFSFKVNDGTIDSAAAQVSINITPVNDAPVAQAQSVSTPQDTPKPITLGATDVDQDLLVYSIVMMPGHGTVMGTPPNVTYLPAAGYQGSDAFTFKASDGQQDSATATVTITVAMVNHAPIVTPQALTLAEDSSVVVTIVATDEDANSMTFSLVDPPMHGAVTGAGPTFTYTPASNFNGADFFTVKANDGVVDSSAVRMTLTVTPVNDAPTAVMQSVQTSEDVSVAILLAGSDADADPLTFTVLDGPAHGVLSGNPPNVTLTPAANYNGDDAFTFKVSDGTLESAPATVTITIGKVNDPPIADAQTVNVELDSPANFTLGGSDPDLDGLTFKIVTQPSHGTLVAGTAPEMTYTPAAGFRGADAFTFAVNDGTVDSAPATVSLVVGAGSTGPTGPTARDRAQVNGWSCGCSQVDSAGVWVIIGIGLVFLGRKQKRAALLTAMLVCGAAGGIAEAKTPPKKAKPVPVPAPILTTPPVAKPEPSPGPVVAKPPVPSGPPTLAVLEFSVTVPNEKLDSAAFSEVEVSSVAQTQLFKVISAAEIQTMLGVERQQQLGGCGEDSVSCLSELTDALGARYVLSGSLGRVGESYLITVRFIDTRRSSVVSRGTRQTDDASLLLRLVWEATQEAIDGVAESLPPEEAAKWKERSRPAPPSNVSAKRSQFGVALVGVGGYQPLAAVGNRASVGGEVFATLRISRFDVWVGLVISPSPGARVSATFAVLATRHRLSAGLRGSYFPLARLVGGGPAVVYEFLATPMFGLSAQVASEFYGGGPSLTVALLGGIGVQAHF